MNVKMRNKPMSNLLNVVAGIALLWLAGCQDRIEDFITVKHGIATVETRAENIWRDGMDCSGAPACADALEKGRTDAVAQLTSGGANVTASGYALRGDELDLVIRYTVPVEKLKDDQIIPITVQRPSDVRAGRPGVPSLAVLHLAGSPTTVDMHGPAVRVTGDLAEVPGASSVATAAGTTPPSVSMDVLSRGHGTIHIVAPSTDNDGKIEHGDTWVQTEPGLKELLATRGMLVKE